MDKNEYWNERASKYSSFKWASDESYLNDFVSATPWSLDDWVLDAGIGTGIVSKVVSPKVGCIIGIDTSRKMLEICEREKPPNVFIENQDIRNMRFRDDIFDKVLARNVFHHIPENLEQAINQCYRVLAKEGRLILGERIPPDDSVRGEYESMIHLKDDRNVFTEKEYCRKLTDAGFKIKKTKESWIRGFDVCEWISGLKLSKDVKNEILFRHIGGSQAFKKACNFKMRNGRCFIDIKNVIIVAIKEH